MWLKNLFKKVILPIGLIAAPIVYCCREELDDKAFHTERPELIVRNTDHGTLFYMNIFAKTRKEGTNLTSIEVLLDDKIMHEQKATKEQINLFLDVKYNDSWPVHTYTVRVKDDAGCVATRTFGFSKYGYIYPCDIRFSENDWTPNKLYVDMNKDLRYSPLHPEMGKTNQKFEVQAQIRGEVQKELFPKISDDEKAKVQDSLKNLDVDKLEGVNEPYRPYLKKR